MGLVYFILNPKKGHILCKVLNCFEILISSQMEVGALGNNKVLKTNGKSKAY